MKPFYLQGTGPNLLTPPLIQQFTQNNPALKNTIRFVDDSTIPNVIINETCERCPLSEDQCAERAAAPIVLRRQDEREKRRQAVQKLLAEMKP